jgi:hypothetical protein
VDVLWHELSLFAYMQLYDLPICLSMSLIPDLPLKNRLVAPPRAPSNFMD